MSDCCHKKSVDIYMGLLSSTMFTTPGVKDDHCNADLKLRICRGMVKVRTRAALYAIDDWTSITSTERGLPGCGTQKPFNNHESSG